MDSEEQQRDEDEKAERKRSFHPSECREQRRKNAPVLISCCLRSVWVSGQRRVVLQYILLWFCVKRLNLSALVFDRQAGMECVLKVRQHQ